MTTPTARETVLGRIRDALALAPAPDTVIPRTYRTGRTLPDGERLALLTDRLVDYRATVHPCTADRTAEVVAGILNERGARRIGVPDGLDERWLGAYDGEVRRDSADVPAPSLDALDGVVTASAVEAAPRPARSSWTAHPTRAGVRCRSSPTSMSASSTCPRSWQASRRRWPGWCRRGRPP